MTTKRVSSSPGSHGLLETRFSGPGGIYEQKIRKYFTARGKPDDYQYSPAEAREAMNYIKHVDRMTSGDSWGSGSSFLQGASSYDDMYKYKDPIQEMGKLENRMDKLPGYEEDPYKENYADSEELDYLAQENDEDEAAKLNSLLVDHDDELETYDSAPGGSSEGTFFASGKSGGESKGLSSNQKIAAKLITDIFGQKEERQQQSIGSSPLTQGRALDMSQYVSSRRPKKERYRNLGLLARGTV